MNEEISNKISQMIRVNHAGELGAKVIYEGQILALKLKGDHQNLEVVTKMRDQELPHLKFFEQKIIEQKVRPTIMQPLWKIGGFALGFATAIIDIKSAMTCTTAVEEAIEDHYQSQINELEKIGDQKSNVKNQDKKTETIENQQKITDNINLIDDLIKNIKQFRQDEIEHRDIGYEHNAVDFKLHKPLNNLIKFTTKFAIAISKKI